MGRCPFSGRVGPGFLGLSGGKYVIGSGGCAASSLSAALWPVHFRKPGERGCAGRPAASDAGGRPGRDRYRRRPAHPAVPDRSEEHTSELQSLMRISYAVFCLKKKNINKHDRQHNKLNTITYTST